VTASTHLSDSFRDAKSALAAHGPLGDELGSQLQEIWHSRASLEELWPAIAGSRTYWSVLTVDDCELTIVCQLALGCVLLHHGVDARAMLLLKLAWPYSDKQGRERLSALHRLRVDRDHSMVQALQPGMDCHDRGEFVAAIGIYDEVIDRYPNLALPIYEKTLSVQARDGGSSPQPESLYTAALLRDPFQIQALRSRGRSAVTTYEINIAPFFKDPAPNPAVVARFAEGATQLGDHWSAAHAHVLLDRGGFGSGGVDLARSLAELGVGDLGMQILFASEDFRRVSLRETLETATSLLGPDTGETPVPTGALLDAAERLMQSGRRTEAAEVAARVLQQDRESVNPRELAMAMSFVACARSEVGLYLEAIDLLRKAAALYEESPDSSAVERASAHHNIASAHEEAGEPFAARTEVLKAEAILGGLGREGREFHTEVRLTHARIEAVLGNVDTARDLLDEVERGSEEWPSDVREARLIRLEELRATLHCECGEPQAAAQALRRLLGAERQLYGVEYPGLFVTESKLALMLMGGGELAEADKLLTRSLERRSTRFGSESTSVAMALNNIGELAIREGNFNRALEVLERCATVRRKHLRADHPDLLATLGTLALVHTHLHETTEAAGLLGELVGADFDRIAAIVGVDDLERRATTHRERAMRGLLVTLALDPQTARASVKRQALEAVTNIKAVSTGLAVRRIRDRGDHPRDTSALQFAASRVAGLAVRGPRGGGIDDYTLELHLALQRLLEEQAREDATGARIPLEFMSLEQMCGSVGDGAMLDISVYSACCLAADSPLEILAGANQCYVATLISSSGIEEMLSLGPVGEIDSLVAAFRDEIELYVSLPDIPEVRTGARDCIWQVCRRLYDATLGQLESLACYEHIALLLDGALGLIPFACLAAADERYAGEQWLFTYLTTIHDLLGEVREADEGEIVVFAAPEYGCSPDPPHDPPVATAPYSEALHTNWTPLARTVEEVEAIRAITEGARLDTHVGEDASKTRLQKLRRPGILHVATHGFYIRDTRVVAGQREGADPDEPPFTIHANDLLRTGIVLAGANARRGLSVLASDDGILTALELSLLDLHGTRLVVMNACESAAGDSLAGDVVHGLRRACHAAGAHSVLSCLWTVSDDDAAQMMEHLYTKLAEEKPLAIALQETMIAALNDDGRSDAAPLHPYHWGAWVLSGDMTSAQQVIAMSGGTR
jgi:CHAT domain-containing protein